MRLHIEVLGVLGCLGVHALALAGQATPDPDRRFFALGDFRLESGITLPHAQLAYATYGRLDPAGRNAILLPSFYRTGHHGYDWLIGPGQALDSSKYFVIATEMFGSGGSSSPSNTPPPFDGPRFPPVTIRDDVAAAYKLLTEALGIQHLAAVVGFSMGAEQAFQWAVGHPDFMDRIVAYCGTARTYPHAAVMLEGAIRAYQADAAFNNGDYTTRPLKAIAAVRIHFLGWVYSQEWWRRELFKPQYPTAHALIEAVATDTSFDPNDEIALARAWQSHNVGDTPGFHGDHEAALRSIKARVLYMPSSTDLYFTLGDITYESHFIRQVTLVPIPTVWGHFAPANPVDRSFIDAQIRGFLH
jgi:homoserine O-acetyltransferase/O-succinyltransferase